MNDHIYEPSSAARRGQVRGEKYTEPADLAQALYDALRQTNDTALIQGRPLDGRATLIDGEFDLVRVVVLMFSILNLRDGATNEEASA